MRIMEPSTDQKIIRIKNVLLGGKLGQTPLVLIGSIFYHKHRIVKDPVKGVFDRKKAEELINLQDTLADTTGLQCMVDVMGETSVALSKYIDFVASVTESPILLNGIDSRVRIETCRHVREVGLSDSIVYTSINYTSLREEYEALKEYRIRNVLVQTFTPSSLLPQQSLKISKMFITKLKEVGVENIMFLPPVLDIPSIGLAIECVKLIKNTLGLPIGLAPCGVVWGWEKIKGNEIARVSSAASVIAVSRLAGSDFIIYGSIRKAKYVFEAAALIDGLIIYKSRILHSTRPLVEENPLNKFVRKRS